MGKIIKPHSPNTMEGEGDPVYDKETQLYPLEAMPSSPVVSEHQQRKLNVNYCFAVTIDGLRKDIYSKDEATDLMFKSHKLLMLSYAKVYGKLPNLPEIRATP